MYLLIGGARSGKSQLAVRMATTSGCSVHVVVTATASDDEMAERIRQHRTRRPPDWDTVEAPRDLLTPMRSLPGEDCIVLDCLSLWVSNRLAEGATERDLITESRQAAAAAADRPGPTIVVTNEVGHGLVPMHPVGRAYRDGLGRTNMTWSQAAEHAWYIVAGRALTLGAHDPTL